MHKKNSYFAGFLALILGTTTIFGAIPSWASSDTGTPALEESEAPDVSETPEEPETSDKSENPEEPETPDKSENPEESETPEEPDFPEPPDDSIPQPPNEEDPVISYAKIHFINLPGCSDAILLESNGHFGMVDSGEDSDYPDGSDPRYPLRNTVVTDPGYEQQVLDYMHSVGVTQDNFDFYLGTHPHSDHIGSADEVIREFHPQRVYLMEYKDEYITSPGLLFDNLYVYDRAIEAAKEVGSILIQNFDVNAPIIPDQAATASIQTEEQATAGADTRSYSYITEEQIEEKYGDSPISEEEAETQTAFPEEGIAVLNSSDPNSTVYSTPASTTGNPNFDLGDLHLQIMNYSDDYKTTGKLDANYFSLGVKVTSDTGYTAFLGGDIGFSDGDEERLAKVLEHIDVLKLGHHGYSNSNSLDYLNALSPSIAIQTGFYKVLPEDRIELLNKMGTRLYSLPEYYSSLAAITLDMDTLELNVPSSNYYFYSKDSSPYLSSYLNGRESAYTGFVDYDGETYHFSNSIVSDEKKWIHANSTWYYADAKGCLVHGWLKNGAYHYYLNTDGSILTGLQTIDDDTYFFNDSGQMLSAQWKWINKKCYYFQKDGTMAKNTWIGTSYVNNDGVWDTSKTTTTQKYGWKQDKNGWWYVHADGSYTRNGWETINGEKYYFDATGYRHVGWLYLKQNYYYFDPTSGVMKTGWIKSGKYWYYLNDSGIMQTGWREIDDKWYYLNSSGMMQTGWLYHKQKWYYLNASGVMQTGWVKVGSTWYYLDSDGIMQTDWLYLYTQTYYLNKSGAMLTSWQTLNNKTYYFDPTSGVMKTGWIKPSANQWYYLSTNGALKTGWQTIGKNTYYFNTDGLMLTGWKKLDSKWYYFGATNDGAMKTYWQKINNVYYFLGEDGIMRTGWQSIWGKWYYLNSSGAMLTGWQKINDSWYLLQSNGARVEGWYTDGKNRYYLMPLTGVMQRYWFSVNGNWYYSNYSGILQTGWITSNGKTYYLDESGIMQTGLKLIDQKWYVFSASGELISSN